MKINDARRAIETYLNTNWTETPIDFENVESRDLSLAGQPLLWEGQNPFLAFDLDIIGSRQISAYPACMRFNGSIDLKVCVKEGTGPGYSTELCDDLLALFQDKVLYHSTEEIRVGTASGPIDYVTSAGWYVQQLQFPFFFNHIF